MGTTLKHKIFVGSIAAGLTLGAGVAAGASGAFTTDDTKTDHPGRSTTDVTDITDINGPETTTPTLADVQDNDVDVDVDDGEVNDNDDADVNDSDDEAVDDNDDGEVDDNDDGAVDNNDEGHQGPDDGGDSESS